MSNKNSIGLIAGILLSSLITASLHAAVREAGPEDLKSAFGYTLGQPIDTSGPNYVTTTQLDRYQIVDLTPTGMDRVDLVLAAGSQRLAMITAEEKFLSNGDCEKFAEDLRAKWQKSLGLSFKRLNFDANDFVAKKGTTEREAGCSDVNFHFALRDDEMRRIAAGEIESRSESIKCDTDASTHVPSVIPLEEYEEHFSPLKKIGARDVARPLNQIAARLEALYNRALIHTHCLDDIRLSFSVVIDQTGRAIEVNDVRVRSPSAALDEFAHREILKERFDAFSERGYRVVEFALHLKRKT